MISFQTSQDIAAPASRIWDVLSRVPDWPAWTPSVSRVEPLDGPGLRPGARFVIHQPGLRPAVWCVDSMNPGESFAWSMHAAGIAMSALHRIVATAEAASTVTLSLHASGPLAPVIWWLIGRTAKRYVVQEAQSLKRRCEQTAGR